VSPRPPNELDTEWDGVIRHTKRGPGQNGYKTHGCRCPGCCEAAKKMYDRRRRSENARKEKMRRGEVEPPHGVTGYRQYGCRCEICMHAGREFNKWALDRDPGRGAREEPIDWSEVEHLKPGHNVRSRTRG